MLHGELDAHSGPGLRAELTALVEASTIPVILDMCATDFCDSAGLNAIIAVWRRATARDLRLGLVGLTPRVRALFQISGVDQTVPIFTDLQDAVHELTAELRHPAPSPAQTIAGGEQATRPRRRQEWP
jgi:anti-sigma B factor antagonist